MDNKSNDKGLIEKKNESIDVNVFNEIQVESQNVNEIIDKKFIDINYNLEEIQKNKEEMEKLLIKNSRVYQKLKILENKKRMKMENKPEFILTNFTLGMVLSYLTFYQKFIFRIVNKLFYKTFYHPASHHTLDLSKHYIEEKYLQLPERKTKVLIEFFLKKFSAFYKQINISIDFDKCKNDTLWLPNFNALKNLRILKTYQKTSHCEFEYYDRTGKSINYVNQENYQILLFFFKKIKKIDVVKGKISFDFPFHFYQLTKKKYKKENDYFYKLKYIEEFEINFISLYQEKNDNDLEVIDVSDDEEEKTSLKLRGYSDREISNLKFIHSSQDYKIFNRINDNKLYRRSKFRRSSDSSLEFSSENEDEKEYRVSSTTIFRKEKKNIIPPVKKLIFNFSKNFYEEKYFINCLKTLILKQDEILLKELEIKFGSNEIFLSNEFNDSESVKHFIERNIVHIRSIETFKFAYYTSKNKDTNMKSIKSSFNSSEEVLFYLLLQECQNLKVVYTNYKLIKYLIVCFVRIYKKIQENQNYNSRRAQYVEKIRRIFEQLDTMHLIVEDPIYQIDFSIFNCICFKNLKILFIKYEKMKEYLNDPSKFTKNLPNLQILKVSATDFPFLKHLSTFENLKKFELKRFIFTENNYIFSTLVYGSQQFVNLSFQENIINFKDYNQIEEILFSKIRIFNYTKNFQISHLKELKKIKIQKFKLKNLFINSCFNLEKIKIYRLLILNSLSIQNCSLLKRLSIELSKIQSVFVDAPFLTDLKIQTIITSCVKVFRNQIEKLDFINDIINKKNKKKKKIQQQIIRNNNFIMASKKNRKQNIRNFFFEINHLNNLEVITIGDMKIIMTIKDIKNNFIKLSKIIFNNMICLKEFCSKNKFFVQNVKRIKIKSGFSFESHVNVIHKLLPKCLEINGCVFV